MAQKAFNIVRTEVINPIIVDKPAGSENVSRQLVQKFRIIVSREAYAVPNLSSDTVKAALIVPNQNVIEIPNVDALISVHDADPTGTLAVSAGGTTITGTGTQFTTEASKGMFLYNPDANEFARIKTISSNTSVILYDPVAQDWTAAAYVIYDSKYAMCGGESGIPSPTIEKIELSYEDNQNPVVWTEAVFNNRATQIRRTQEGNPFHCAFTLSFSNVDANKQELTELEDYFFHLLGAMDVIESQLVDEITA